jgi:hypothetical protein
LKPPRVIDARGIPLGLRDHIEQMNKVLSNISFGDLTNNRDFSQNIVGWYASVTSPGIADTEFAVPHNLGRVPNGWLVLSKSNAGVVYKGATAWTSSNIYLKDSGISDVLLLFIV